MSTQTNAIAVSQPFGVTQNNLQTSHLFQPGKSGNPGGRPKTKMFRRRLLKSLMHEVNGVQRFDDVIEALVEEAASGNVRAFEAARDTVDGRPGPDSDVAAASTVFAPVFMSIADPSEK